MDNTLFIDDFKQRLHLINHDIDDTHWYEKQPGASSLLKTFHALHVIKISSPNANQPSPVQPRKYHGMAWHDIHTFLT